VRAHLVSQSTAATVADVQVRYCAGSGCSCRVWREWFLPEVREFITRNTAYNKHDTGWAKRAPSKDHTTPPFLIIP
jgi:hypothetical protein